MNLKAVIYSLFLVLIISSDLICSGYMLLCEDHKIELSADFSSEKESKEKTEMDEEAYEFTLSSFRLYDQSDKQIFVLDDSLFNLNSIHNSIPSPPPDLS